MRVSKEEMVRSLIDCIAQADDIEQVLFFARLLVSVALVIIEDHPNSLVLDTEYQVYETFWD